MNRTAVAVGFVVLMVLWPVATAGAGGGTSASTAVESATDQLSGSTDGSGETVTTGGETDDGAQAGWWPVHRDGDGPTLFDVNTSADGEPAVDEPTTLTVTLTAVADAESVTVTLPDYRFVEGDGRNWSLGAMETGETRTLSLTVTPTEEIAQHLQFTARGEQGARSVSQRFSHRLGVVERGLSSGTIQLSATSPESIPDTTVDPLGNRTASGSSAATGSASASNGYVKGAFFVDLPGGGVDPVRGARVEVWEEDPGWNPDNHIATGKTDAQGRFNVTVNDPAGTDKDNVADVYVLVYAENRVVKVTKGGQYRVRRPSGSNTLRNGEVTDVGSFVPASAQPAFQATTWAWEAFEFVKAETGFTRRKIEVKWPKTDWPSYHPAYGSAGNVRPKLERITLPDRSDQDGQSWDRTTMYHEYAHAQMMAMYEYSRGNKPNKGSYEGHRLYSETDPGFAMVEGWAAFMEAAVSQDGSVSRAEFGDWFDTPPQNPSDSPDGDLGDMDGNVVEGAYANLFWDITDGGPTDDDGINGSKPGVGFEQVFDTVADHNVQSLKDFLSKWDDGHDEALARAAFESGVLIEDPYGPNNQFSTAAPIGIESINATIGSGIDYYRLVVPRWTDPSVSIRDVKRPGSGSSGDLDLVVYDSAQSRVGASETSSDNEFVALPSTGESTATYYVEVHTDNGSPAAYELVVGGHLVDDDEEENDELRDAAVIAGDGSTERYRLTTDTVDYYKTWVEDQGTVNVSVQRGNDHAGNWDDAAGLFKVELYHENGTFLRDTIGQTGVPTINYTTDDADRYVVAVTTRQRYTPLSYDLNVNATPPDNDRFEPNDDEDRASVQYPPGANAILVDGEDDWYGRWVSKGSELNVTIPAVSGELIWFEIDHPSGYEVAQGRDGDSLVIHDTDAGEYKIRVWTRHANTAEYQLYVEDDPTPNIDPGPDAFEANDDFASATFVNRHFSNESLTIHDDDDDYYRLSLNEGDRLNVTLSYNSSHMTGSPSLQLYGPGQLPLQNAGFGDHRSVTIQQDGTYYVEASGNGAYPYSLTIEGNDEYEDNDARTNAALWPTINSGLSTVVDEAFNATLVDGEDDWHSLYLTEGQRLSTDVRATDTLTFGLPAGYLNVSIYDDQGSRLAQSEPNGEAVARAPSNGTYYVRVHPWDDRGYTTDYELSMRTSPEAGSEPDDSLENATLYTPGDDERSLALDDGSDVDTYAVYLERGQGMEVNLDFQGTSDVDIELLEPDGSLITQTTTGPLNEIALSADTIAIEDGYHYVRVHGANTATAYDLSIEEVEDDEWEPNDDRSTAAPIQFRTIEGRLFEGVGDSFGDSGTQRDETDLFAVTVTEPTTLNATLTFDQHGVSNSTIEDGSDLDLALLDDIGTVVAANSSTGDVATVRAQLSLTGTYYLRVNATSLDTVTPYELSVARDGFTPVVGGVRNVGQHLNTPVTSAAGSLMSDESIELQLESGVNVSHAVQLRAGERLNLSTRGDGDLDIALYDATGTQLRSSASTGASEAISYQATTNGTYYVETSAGGETRTTGTLTATTDVPTNDRFEANDDRGSATPITVGEYGNLHTAPGDPDYFAIELAAGQQLSIDATFDAVEGPLEVALLGPEGGELSVDTGRETGSVEVAAETAGTYYVRVDSAEVGLGGYALSVDVATPNNDAFEGNNGIETAQPLTPGSYEGLRIATGDRDVFAVELADGEQLRADVAFDQGEGNLDLYLYGPEGEVRALSGSETDDESASLRAATAGTYYVEVHGHAGASADYRLSLATDPLPADDRFEDNDHLESVTALQPGTYEELQILPGDQDLYAVETPADETLDANITFSHEAGNLDLEVYGPDRRLLGTSTTYTDTESISVATGDGGTHYVRVRGVGDAVAAYDLTVDVTGTEPPTDGPDVDPIGGGDPPTDLDGDGRYEDVDGNGDGNLFDALAYYNNLDSETITANPERFDFDGDGTSGDLFDALALYNHLKSL